MENSIENSMENSMENTNKYIETLTEIEKKALEIAKINLESSFCLDKSIGYLNWLKAQNGN